MAARRVRRPGHFRGWTARQMTPEALARDIARSIRQGSGRPVEAYTADTTVQRLVHALLQQAA
jgi:hypothetical protein